MGRDDVVAPCAPRVGARRRGVRRHGGAARPSLPVGVRRPAVPGRRGRLLHQRLHPRERRLAGRRRLPPRGVVRGARLPDGGWNCAWVEGSTRSSFHSSLNSLRGRLAYEVATGGTDELRAARRAGEEYLLERRLLYAASTGELVGPWATRFTYPFRWAYSALRALDHVRAAALHDGTPPAPPARRCRRRRARRPAGRRDVAAGGRSARTRVVRGRRAPGRAVAVAHVLRRRVLSWWDEAAPAGGG